MKLTNVSRNQWSRRKWKKKYGSSLKSAMVTWSESFRLFVSSYSHRNKNLKKMEFGEKHQYELSNILGTTEGYLNIRHNSCPQRSYKVNMNSNHVSMNSNPMNSIKSSKWKSKYQRIIHIQVTINANQDSKCHTSTLVWGSSLMDWSWDATDTKLSSLKHSLDYIPITIKQLD